MNCFTSGIRCFVKVKAGKYNDKGMLRHKRQIEKSGSEIGGKERK